MDFDKKNLLLNYFTGYAAVSLKLSVTLLQNRILTMFHHASLWSKNKVTQYYPASQFFSRVFNKLE